MTALPLAGWRSFRLASSPGDPPRVLVGTSPEGREVSLGEALDHGHGVWSCVLLGPDGRTLMEEGCRDEQDGLCRLYGWTQYLSGGGSWEPSSRQRTLEGSSNGRTAAGSPARADAERNAGSSPAPSTRRLRHNGPEARPATTEVGRRLQEARLAKGWTQADLARRVRSRGWPSVQAAISGLERGALSSSHFTPRIEAVLGISLGAPSRSEVCGQREAVGELGQRLREAREAKRLSLSAVARLVVAEGAGAQETVRATLCSLERGRLKKSLYLPAILRVLGLEAE